MWKERLKRALLILGAAGLIIVGAGVARRWQPPTEAISEKLGGIGSNILGRAVEILPVGEKIKEEIIFKEARTQEAIETKEIIEILKELPQEQLEQIKNQVFKDFCEKVMGE